MQVEKVGNKKETGEKWAAVLYWAAWCFLGLDVVVIVSSTLIGDLPGMSPWKKLLFSIRINAYYIYYTFVLFGLSAILKVGNAVISQLRTLNTGLNGKDEQKQ